MSAHVGSVKQISFSASFILVLKFLKTVYSVLQGSGFISFRILHAKHMYDHCMKVSISGKINKQLELLSYKLLH